MSRDGSATSSRAKDADYGQHHGAADKRHQKPDAQASRVPARNYADQRRHERASQRCQCKHRAAHFSRARTIPLGKPGNKNGKDTGKTKTCEKSAAKERDRRMCGKKDELTRCREQQPGDRNDHFLQMEKDGRGCSASAEESREEKHGGQRPGVATPGRGSLCVRRSPI